MEAKGEPENTPETGADMRGTLLKRLAVAGVLVAILLGILAVFDRLATAPSDEAEHQVFNKPVPVAPRKEVSQPVTPATNLPPPPVAPVSPLPQPVVEPKTAAPAEPAPPSTPDARREAASAAGQRAPAPVTAPVAPVTPVVPSGQVPVNVAGSAPASIAVRPVRPAPEASASPSAQPEPVAPAPAQAPAPAAQTAPKPTARVIETRSAPEKLAPEERSPVAQRLLPGFLLQAGVFSSVQRAEELHARLTLSGVPSSLETRVQVGPFRTRQEAEAARARLKELGIESVMLQQRAKP